MSSCSSCLCSFIFTGSARICDVTMSHTWIYTCCEIKAVIFTFSFIFARFACFGLFVSVVLVVSFRFVLGSSTCPWTRLGHSKYWNFPRFKHCIHTSYLLHTFNTGYILPPHRHILHCLEAREKHCCDTGHFKSSDRSTPMGTKVCQDHGHRPGRIHTLLGSFHGIVLRGSKGWLLISPECISGWTPCTI